jgi:hypothetical protein
MRVTRSAPQASLTEVLDRVLDRGIVVDAWLRVSVAGIALIDVDARIVVASIDTYVRRSEAVAHAVFGAPPTLAPSTAAPARRHRRRPRVRLHCGEGCTFTRPAGRRPAAVRCPFERGRACAVTGIPVAA